MTTNKNLSGTSLIAPLYYEDTPQSLAWDKRAYQVVSQSNSPLSRIKQAWYSYFMSVSRRP